ncbi:ABC transporter ATP-binding protein [Dysgonomonas sp. Marseille-P4677]|uniref:ABC transporter ATP-binding protein n=1 Tax=Dysgonomonas sp. Marseille-P4677 TaxID=2364790 RepID=UPI0019142439|nr:ABC transporter ATP-binding protein [Dysgonomonas sp. Marseille-P4677]MBK5722221.1 ABC transporter ATP-binding protein [Dysgonomonas sp. Marseille-P4677]
MIILENINKIFYTKEIETQALLNINLTIEKGEFVSIMGPSGCGKSTLLNIIGLLDNPTSGNLSIDGVNARGMKEKELAYMRNMKLGFIFQNFHLIRSMTVKKNVELPMTYRKKRASLDKKDRVITVLEKVGLAHRIKHYPSQLSGGQCQRVAIARAIIGEPEIILADEPTGNLDSTMGAEIMEILKTLNKEGVTIVMVTHDVNIAKQTSRIVKLLNGKRVQ